MYYETQSHESNKMFHRFLSFYNFRNQNQNQIKIKNFDENDSPKKANSVNNIIAFSAADNGKHDELSTKMDRFLCGCTILGLGSISKLVLQIFNSTTLINRENLVENLYNRVEGQGLVTVSNHVTMVDDPGIMSTIIYPHHLFDFRMVRWTLCAKERCFRNEFLASIFTKGKVLPIDRGGGIYQRNMDYVIEKLDRGDWVHMFPEGRRSKTNKLGQMKQGVARLIADPLVTPIVVPIYHLGIRNVLPIGRYVPWSIGQNVIVVIGKPIDMEDLKMKYLKNEIDKEELYTLITGRIGKNLEDLSRKAEAVQRDRLER